MTQPEEQPAPLATPSPAAFHPSDAERRQLTVMFCDLVDYIPLSEALDPEELREVVRTYHRVSAEVIQRVDGHIAQLLGDGLLVYFGWPQAHDDDAQRAVQAGLGIIGTMETLNTRLQRDKGLRLAVRVGIHTGQVVVGEMGGSGRQEQLALGDTPNVAARIQGLAASDTVLISAATHRLVQGYFTVAALGTQTLKGVAAPQGKRAEARELLALIYGWFAEGFDTADLQEAKALLEELTEEGNSPAPLRLQVC
jgi:class 3 adenylate cyclase